MCHQGRILRSIFSWGNFADFLEDTAEISGVVIAATRGDFLERHIIVLQHEFRPIDPHEVQIIVKTHKSFLAKQPRHVIGGEAKMVGNTVTAERRMKVLLHE